MAKEQHVPWTHLIRFVSDEDDSILFGDAIVPDDDFDIGHPANLSGLTARVISGDPLRSLCKVTEKVVKVKKLLGPLTQEMVPAIRCIGGNYKSHLEEIGAKPPQNPPMFSKTTNTIAGYGDDVEIPKFVQDDQVDYEGELAFVIAKDAKNVKKEEALDYILGYTSANDLSARKWQMDPNLVGTFPPPQMTYGKSLDGFCPLGPSIVSSRIISDPHRLSLLTKVNGDVRQKSNTDQLYFRVPEIIEFLSRGTTLHAGSVVLTGTPSGVGFTMKPPQFLKAGDTVEITFGKVGTLVHGVSYE